MRTIPWVQAQGFWKKIPGDLSKTEVIKLLEIRGVNPRRIRFKRRCKNLEKVFMGNELSGATSV